MDHKNVRVRFAPSPTGHLHIGSVRVALFNWLFARHYDGSFLLRIEDTDTERSTQEYADSIVTALRWLSLESDESFVVQSTRLDVYKHTITKLLEEGKAYRCFTPEAEVEAFKRECIKTGVTTGYRSQWRDKQPTEQELQKPYAIRFKVPQDISEITVSDLIHSDIMFDVSQIDDFVIQRSDGMPTYNFVVVVDDNEMRITHVIRGEDHLSNTPKQILLYQALGFELPAFAHLPLILGPSGDRLSKRDAAVSVLDYRAQGYLPDAFCNYLVRLGWSHGDQEIFTRDEMVSYFSFEHVGKKGAIFDETKLQWVNGIYMREAVSTDLLDSIVDLRPDFLSDLSNFGKEQVLLFIDLYKDRSKTLMRLADTITELSESSRDLPADSLQEWATERTCERMERLQAMLSHVTDFSVQLIKDSIKTFCKEHSISLALVAKPIRLALTGSLSSPGVFVLLSCFGKEESLHRLANFVTLLRAVCKKNKGH